MQIVKDRLLLEGQRVHVYYNLHKGGYSIRDKKTMHVVAYADNVLLHNCVFNVAENDPREEGSECMPSCKGNSSERSRNLIQSI